MGICIRLQSITVVPSSGGELESALFCQTKALAFPAFVRNVRPLWIKGSQKAVEWGDYVPGSGRVGFASA